jgi:hypothetical protein
LFRRVVNGLNGLVDRHVQLVKQELKEELLTILTAGKTLGISAAIAIVGALILLNVVVMMLVLSLNWIGLALVGENRGFLSWLGGSLGWFVILILIGVIFVVAYKLMRRGVSEVQISPLEESREALREDIEWARQLLTRNER